LRREEPERAVMLETLGALYTLGQPLNWDHLFPEGGRYAPLPTYAWQRERFWIARRPGSGGSGRAAHWWERAEQPGHPLLGLHMQPAAQPGRHLWQIRLGRDEQPYLADHQVEGLVMLPATAWVELALAAVEARFGPGRRTLEQIEFK